MPLAAVALAAGAAEACASSGVLASKAATLAPIHMNFCSERRAMMCFPEK